MPKKIFYLGVEGGATKSMAILSSDDREIILTKKGGALNYHNTGESGTKNNLSKLIFPLLKKARGEKIHAVFGFAGLDTPVDKRAYRKIVHSLMPKSSKFELLNDANIALEARCPGEKNRVLVISGTGATVYGESGRKRAKSIGWDHILGDEGSAYSAGVLVLKAATKSFDGRTKKSVFERLVPESMNYRSMTEFMPKFYAKLRKNEPKFFIASFAPMVNDAIRKNDWAALEIRKQVVNDLVVGVRAVASSLNFKNKEFCLGIIGSQWKMPGLLDNFKKEVKKEYKKAYFSKNNDSGAWGAVLLAKKL